jgi:hypothetical protein
MTSIEDELQGTQPPLKMTFIEDEFQKLDISLCLNKNINMSTQNSKQFINLETMEDYLQGRRPQ